MNYTLYKIMARKEGGWVYIAPVRIGGPTLTFSLVKKNYYG